MYLTFCKKCGEELSDDALFCPKCGIRTPKGRKEKAQPPWEDAIAEAREEIDKGITTAFEEIQKGLKTAREEIKKATSKETVKCSNCGEVSSAEDIFCWSCGRKLG